MHEQFFKILQHEAAPWDPQKGKFNYIKWLFFDINQTNIKFFISCLNFLDHYNFWNVKKKIINLVSLESHNRVEYTLENKTKKQKNFFMLNRIIFFWSKRLKFWDQVLEVAAIRDKKWKIFVFIFGSSISSLF